jgi:pSer/pThr/pTyr-binding forkhead associated (FHA) protein
MTRRNDPPNAERASDRAMDLALVEGGQRAGKAFLMASSGETAGMVFPLTLPMMVIGRAPSAEIRVNEHAVSNEHARLEGAGGRYSIVDLGSTNGTYVNGQRVVARVPLSGGDTIRTGATTFTFVTRETGTAAATLKLGGTEVSAPLTARAASPSPTALREARVLSNRQDDQDDAVSLTDVVRTVKTYWVYTKRYGWLAATATFFGIAAGIAQARMNPPPGAAWFEMTLATETRGEEGEAVKAPFVAAESTFKSLPLIKKTLRELDVPDASDNVASDVQGALNFEQAGYNSKLFRGDYQDATAEQAVIFLSKHVEVYVNSEIDKILKVMRADAEFDRSQAELAAQQVAKIRDRLIVFMNEHPGAVPKDAKAPDIPVTRVPAGASAAQLDTAILAGEQALAGAFRSIQAKKAATYVEQASSAESKMAEARARGLADQHPEVKNLANLATTMRGKAAQILSSEPTAAEQSLDPDVTRLRQDLNDLRTKRAALPAAPAGARPVATVAKPAVQENLAQLKLQYAELARDYERAKTDHEALLKKRETTDRLLERERKSAEARYDIITPPTAEQASAFKAILKRAGFGGGVGFGLALVAAVCLELRRILKARGHI